MSHIFDALQRSEAERSGVEVETLAELLQIAEPAVPQPQPSQQVILPEVPPLAEPVMAPHEVPQPPTQVTDSPAAGSNSTGPLEQFESLPVVLLPDSKLVSVTQKDSLAAEKFRFLHFPFHKCIRIRKESIAPH